MLIRVGDEDRRIARLAVPALGALAAEPLYTLVDTAIVGHLGVSPLAALALAGAVLTGVATLCNFLEYGSTPSVGRLFATGAPEAAAHLGRQAVLLAIGLGVLSTLLVVAVAQPLLELLGAHGRVLSLGLVYIRLASIGLPFALIAVASSGYFRGVARLRMPLIVLLAGNCLNVVLELLFVYQLHWGIAGSAWGTVIAQAAMAVTFIAIIGRGSSQQPLIDWTAMRSLATTGSQIFIRTGALYASFLVAGAVLARIGTASLAAHQIAFQLWGFLALALDAMAIAAQVLVSHALAIGDTAAAKRSAARVIGWSLIVGCVFAVGLLGLEPVLATLFTSNPMVLNRVHAVWPLFALMQPVNAVVFALDGILIGAGDTRYLALAMAPCALLVFAPLALIALLAGWGIVGVWAALFAFVVARLLTCGARFLGEGWTTALRSPVSADARR